ncbi:DMT family transporter [Desmonostoc muscorum LEGE 12446]|uniref:DMT family transporter n=1 Tax=Desmonostoc muscorum LEGE 12446 TaxID=1828758 RepID=A0A8J7A104_DESMC|nr:DMT family transporter [Desmonostoc muscorum]MCF2146128.1 DMT family transporter [Desmonostoc muscorum LEGE 12446]
MSNQLELAQQQIDPKPDILAYLSMPVAVFLLSLAAIFIKLSEKEIGSNATIFNRFWIGAVAFGLWNSIQASRYKLSADFLIQNEAYTIRDIIIFVVLAIINIGSLLSWAWSITQTSIANANLLHNLNPLFATLGGWLFLGHRFGKKFLISLVLALGGTIIIGIKDWQVSADNFIGDGVALVSAVFYAASFVLRERLRTKFKTTNILLWSCTLGSLFTLPIVIITEDRVFPSSFSGWLAVICLAILCQVVGQGLVTYNLKKFSAGFVSLFLLLEPIIAAILAWAIFSEELSLINWLAFLVICAGIYLAKSEKPFVFTPTQLSDSKAEKANVM